MKNKRIDYENMHSDLIESVITSPHTCAERLDQCRFDSRYKNDEKYKVIVDTSIALMYEMTKKYELAIQLISVNIKVARKLAMWEVLVYNYNTLGNVYGFLNMKEKSLEALLEVVRLEKTYQLIQMTSIAYVNIGILYQRFDLSKSLNYFKLAFQHVEIHGKKLRRYDAKMYFIMSKLIAIYSMFKAFDTADDYIDKAQLYTKDIDQYEIATYKESMLIYYLYQKKYDESKALLCDVLQLFLEMNDQVEYLQILGYYGELCQKLNVPYKYYIPILEIVSMDDFNTYPVYKMSIINTLINYYIDVKLENKLFDAYRKFVQCKHVNIKIKKINQLLSIELVKQDAIIKNENRWIKERRGELNILIDELKASRDSLEYSSEQMNLSYELGQIIMSSNTLQDTIYKLYRRLDGIYKIDDFWIAGYNLDTKQFKALGGYKDKCKINDENERQCFLLEALLVYFIKKKIIVSNRLIKEHDVDAEDAVIMLNQEACVADIHLPLYAQNKLLGVLLMRYKDDRRMNQNHVRFLNRIQAFLCIALNKLNYSFQLKREIAEHEEAKRQLIVLNQALYNLSKYDNLTKVYNRRIFDLKFEQLFNQAVMQQDSVACFMMDIDYFKLYNDTYGHVKGDKTLCAVANQIKYSFSNNNALFARYGGEEFIAFATGLTVEGYDQLAQSVLKAVRQLDIESKSSDLGIVSISIGYVVVEIVRYTDKDIIIKHSDECLYKAKVMGRNRAERMLIERQKL